MVINFLFSHSISVHVQRFQVPGLMSSWFNLFWGRGREEPLERSSMKVILFPCKYIEECLEDTSRSWPAEIIRRWRHRLLREYVQRNEGRSEPSTSGSGLQDKRNESERDFEVLLERILKVTKKSGNRERDVGCCL